MAITRREFVTRLGSLAAAMGLSQVDLARIQQAFAHGGPWSGGDWKKKPKIVWVHGAECTGCSTSLLGLFEDGAGKAVEDRRLTAAVDSTKHVSTLVALDLAVGGDGDLGALTTPNDIPSHPNAHRTLNTLGLDVNKAACAGDDEDYIVTIADVLYDVIDLQYHETVMGMGSDLAYQWLADNMYNGSAGAFVLVVEGAVQVSSAGGAWGKTGDAAWCSVGMDAKDGTDYSGTTNGGELKFDDVVARLAAQDNCKAVISIGQCAAFGGYPACKSPAFGASQTPAYGVYDFLKSHAGLSNAEAVAGKVVNVPGCPVNPWWFVLTVVLWVIDATKGPGASPAADGPLGILKSDWSFKSTYVDYARRLKHVYGTPVHGPACNRYLDYTGGKFASKPGDAGCLLKIGCKGPSTNSLCGLHGWNGHQPQNPEGWDGITLSDVTGSSKQGSFCTAAGHPCMGCTEKGYPDYMLPFVKL